jgi:RNA polymerase sigma-70 factor (ECF subfamily)
MKRTDEFNTLYRLHYSNVYRLCLSYVSGNSALATELAQEVFIKVWQNRARFREESKISTWIYRITVNTCLMHLRKIKKQQEVPLTDLAETAEEEHENNNRKLNMLRACMKKLDEMGKMLISLVLDEIPQKEIAEITGMSHENVRVKVHRTKGKLFKCITLKEQQTKERNHE